MSFFKGKKDLPLALLATRSEAVLSDGLGDEFQVSEAASTLGALRLLEKAPALVIADLDDLVESPQVSRQALAEALRSAVQEQAVVLVSSQEYQQDPPRWSSQAMLQGGRRSGIRYLPPRVAMVTNYCGGVGKTTLACALVRQFRQVSGLPAAIVEIGVGASSLNARLGAHPTLYNVITQGQAAQDWEKVKIFPSDNWETETLAGDGRLASALKGITRDHTLTVFDVFPSNPLWKHALELATDVIVVTISRPDAIAQTEAILRWLNDETVTLNPRPRLHLVLNQVRSAGERIALAGQISAWVGYEERRADRLEGRLAEPLLGLLYSGWTQKRKP